MNFVNDLKFGKEYEKLALKYFEYVSYKFSEGKNKEYDIALTRLDGGIDKVEVKSDRIGKWTGNIAIEYECNYKPSGITSTCSDYWVYFVEGVGVYKFHIDNLREIFKNNIYKCISGGDGYRSKMKLIPMTELTNFKMH